MSKNDILKQLHRLSPKARQAIRAKLDELDGLTDADWKDDGELSDEEIQLIEDRIEAHRKNPAGSIPWAEAEARIKARYGI